GGQALPAGLEHHAPVVGSELVVTCRSSHGPDSTAVWLTAEWLREGEVAEQFADPAQVTQPRLGGAADPAADRLDRDPELAGGDLHGHAFAAQRGRHPVGEGGLLLVGRDRPRAAG